MSACTTSVKTPSGVFTFYKKKVTICDAKLECARRNQILAPLTNAEDIRALRSIVNTSCEFHRAWSDYHIGLDISMCGKKQTRLFSNNVIWNDEKHGKLYKWAGTKRKNINVARFSDYITDTLFIVKDSKRGQKFRFICLKPSTETSCPASLSSENSFSLQSSSIISGAILVVAVGSIFMIAVKNRRLFVKKVAKLENENNHLKKENETLLNKFNNTTK